MGINVPILDFVWFGFHSLALQITLIISEDILIHVHIINQYRAVDHIIVGHSLFVFFGVSPDNYVMDLIH